LVADLSERRKERKKREAKREMMRIAFGLLYLGLCLGEF
jgi:hypothetical protein